MSTTQAPEVACQWYVKCTNPAIGAVTHPAIDSVLVCQRCADKHNLKPTPARIIDLDDDIWTLDRTGTWCSGRAYPMPNQEEDSNAQ